LLSDRGAKLELVFNITAKTPRVALSTNYSIDAWMSIKNTEYSALNF
jgi:hypothetical protein